MGGLFILPALMILMALLPNKKKKALVAVAAWTAAELSAQADLPVLSACCCCLMLAAAAAAAVCCLLLLLLPAACCWLLAAALV
jgi:hypothetical protein